MNEALQTLVHLTWGEARVLGGGGGQRLGTLGHGMIISEGLVSMIVDRGDKLNYGFAT